MKDIQKQLTAHFNLDELLESVFYEGKNQDGVPYQEDVIRTFFDLESAMDEALEWAKWMEEVRAVFARPISINIAYRPLWWEKKQGRSGKSQHVKINASDIRVAGTHPHDVYDRLNKAMREGKVRLGGLGKYNTFTHIDKRGSIARWDFT